uniref:Uncharacterized protein n=1 Tax=Parascaris equorum TaxID=6256 RepID=A0A914RZQ8_PAREQ
MHGTCKHRSGSQEAGSASAGSIVSGPDLDEDGFLSGSGIDFDPDDPRFVEKRLRMIRGYTYMIWKLAEQKSFESSVAETEYTEEKERIPFMASFTEGGPVHEARLFPVMAFMSEVLGAFSIEHKMKVEMIRNYLDAIRLFPCVIAEDQASPSSTANDDDVPIVISRLDIVSTFSEPNPDIYSIEVEWSDKRTSYVVKTADQIADLHNRLLDDFPSEAGAQTENPRLLPALPDLPARVLVCPVMRDFFYASRLGSTALTSPPQSLISHSLPCFGAAKVFLFFNCLRIFFGGY